MTTVFTLPGMFGVPDNLLPMLRGEVTTGNTVVPLWYINWIDPDSASADGARRLHQAIMDCDDDMVGFGHSLGSVVISRWLHDYGPKFPELACRLRFVAAGNSRRRHTGFLTALHWADAATIPVDTPFSVIDVARRGDGWAVWPTNIWDCAAIMKAFDGQAKIHPYYEGVSLTDPANTACTEGNVTFIDTP